MSRKRVSDMTDEEIREMAGAGRHPAPRILTSSQQREVDSARAMLQARDEGYAAIKAGSGDYGALRSHVAATTGADAGTVDEAYELGVALARMESLLAIISDLTGSQP